jgi:Asp/Glu/hydantoin racemase
MAHTIAMIHTSASMIPVFKALADELLPGRAVFNVVDESLLRDIVRDGRCAPATARRLVGHVLSAEAAGADVVCVSCSSMGRAVEASRALCAVPVLRVDEPMAERAVATAPRVGVIATLPSTLEPTVALIEATAAKAAKAVTLLPEVVDGAFAAVIGGDGARHDVLVGAALKRVASRVDVIVLAQASMARVVESLAPSDRPVPVLSSPRLAVERLAELTR